MALEFINNIYEFLFILAGIAGLVMGFNRAIKKEEEESNKLKAVAFISAFIIFGTIILLLLNGAGATNYTLFFGIMYFMSIIARPLKKIPFAFLAAIIIGFGIFYLVFSNIGDTEVFGSIPLEYLVIGIVVIVIIIFIIGFFQESVMDGFLMVIGWAPIVITLSLVLIIQGITLLIGWPNSDGILYYLPG